MVVLLVCAACVAEIYGAHQGSQAVLCVVSGLVGKRGAHLCGCVLADELMSHDMYGS
jgi:hypothetical protein